MNQRSDSKDEQRARALLAAAGLTAGGAVVGGVGGKLTGVGIAGTKAFEHGNRAIDRYNKLLDANPSHPHVQRFGQLFHADDFNLSFHNIMGTGSDGDQLADMLRTEWRNSGGKGRALPRKPLARFADKVLRKTTRTGTAIGAAAGLVAGGSLLAHQLMKKEGSVKVEPSRRHWLEKAAGLPPGGVSELVSKLVTRAVSGAIPAAGIGAIRADEGRRLEGAVEGGKWGALAGLPAGTLGGILIGSLIPGANEKGDIKRKAIAEEAERRKAERSLKKEAARHLPYAGLHNAYAAQSDSPLTAALQKIIGQARMNKTARPRTADDFRGMDDDDLNFLGEQTYGRPITEGEGGEIRVNRAALGGVGAYGLAAGAGRAGGMILDDSGRSGIETVVGETLHRVGKRRVGLGLAGMAAALLASGTGREIAEGWNDEERLLRAEMKRRGLTDPWAKKKSS